MNLSPTRQCAPIDKGVSYVIVKCWDTNKMEF